MLAGLLCAAAPGAWAQESEPAPSGDGSTQVIVKGEKHRKPDRDVYEVDKDVQAADGTVADALNKVPGVAVDPSGNVTLRGRHVEIYVNGHPSLILAGDNRGAALRSMPSRYISSIEVISTPGARFGSQGSGGIINLVSNHGLPDSWFGAAGIRTISTDGIDSNVFLNWHVGKLTASGFLFYTRNVADTASSQSLTALDASGLPLQTTDSHGVSHSVTGSLNASGNFEYELGADDLLRGQASFMQMKSRSGGMTRYTAYNAGGQPDNPYTDENAGRMDMDSATLGLGWTHYGNKPDETLKIDGVLSRRRNDSRFQDRYSGGQQGFNAVNSRTETRTADFTLDYNTAVGDDQLSTGLQLTRDHETTRNSGTTAAFDSAFDYRQTLSAAYITYQKEFGDKWTALAGLRAEMLDLDTYLIRSHSTGHVTDTRLNPSFFATYVISPKARWRFSYAHRLQRPHPRDLNPYVIYIDATHLSSGTPHLRPQETGAWEAVYEYTDQGDSYTARGFYNRDRHLITAASTAEADSAGNTIIRTMAVNSGTAASGGIEVSGNRHLSPKLYLNAAVTVQAMQMPDFDRPGSQSLMTVSGNIGLDYTLSARDGLNFNFNRIGKQLTGQGAMSSYAFDTLSWRHSLTPKVQMTVSLSNMLRMARMSSVTNTRSLRSRFASSPRRPTLSISLNRSFGSFSKK